MYPIPPTETLIENKICRFCSASFPITDKDLEFYEKVSPTFEGKKYQIPTPTVCPDCRQQRRLSFHNERKLYKRKCSATEKEIVSIYSPDKPYTIFSQGFWWSDLWDPLDYGRKFDFSRSFFEQFEALFLKVPKQALVVQEEENSSYLNFAYQIHNCYLIFASSTSENCYYGNRVNVSNNCIDCLLVKKSENCYECISTYACYGCNFCQRITNCRESLFLKDSMGCSHCYMCTNLRNRRYYIKNIAYSEEEYHKEKEKYQKKTLQEQKNEYTKFLMSQPSKCNNNINSQDCFGENLQNTKHTKNVFDGDMLEDIAYSYFVDDVHDSMDIDYGNINTVLHYEVLGSGANAHSILFSINTWPNVKNLAYCETCIGCHNCFGCTGLRNKSYCILNKQYTKEEYEILVPKIIEHMMKTGEWGEFFPSTISPFGYNETVAQEYFPLSREEALGTSHPELPLREALEIPLGCVSGSSNGRQDEDTETSSVGRPRFNWSDYEAPFPRVEKIIPAGKLPENIADIPDDILNWAIECEITKKPFRIIKQELDFYRKHNLPIPRRHPDQRHEDRMKQRNPRKLFERKCDKCGKEIISTYSPKWTERVYCEGCYTREVIT